jgi:hypothetical protein
VRAFRFSSASLRLCASIMFFIVSLRGTKA